MANLELGIQMKPEFVFKIASISKPFTALALFTLLEDNKIKLTDPITKYVPSLKSDYDIVEIKHLLSHTSGIVNYGPQLIF